jgi:hypothetical protein
MNLLGFWSYVHADDEVDMGRVVQLAKDIVANYEAIQAEEIELFLDADSLHWGDAWKDKVDDALSNVAFFIPVITPRYFKRVECRRELQFFASKAKRLGISKLILPMLYIDVPELHEDVPDDPLMQRVKEIQWRPWIDHRYKERGSEQYRQAVGQLAEELVRRVALVERVDAAAVAEAAEESERSLPPAWLSGFVYSGDVYAVLGSGDNERGTMDKIALLELAMPRWSVTLEAISKEIEAVGAMMEQASQSINRGDEQGRGFAARLVVARRVASDLGGPVGRLELLGQKFATDLAEIDEGVRAFLEQCKEEYDRGTWSASDLAEFCSFLDSVRSLSQSARDGLGNVEGMIKSSQPLEKMSRDMRPVLRRLRTSLTAMLEAREITAAWAAVVDDLGVDCGGVSATP